MYRPIRVGTDLVTKMLYYYTYGEEAVSPCGCCSPEESDRWYALITKLTPDEMREKARKHTEENKRFYPIHLLASADDNGLYLSGAGDYMAPDLETNQEFQEINIREWKTEDILSKEEIEKLVSERKEREEAERKLAAEARMRALEMEELEKLNKLAKKYGKTIS